jgi:beta-glucosidase-like glycosyl hydrolase
VGFYQPRDNIVFTITRDGNQLLTRFTGQQRPIPFYPESGTEFFAKAINDHISFITDAEGRVESLILHQPHRDIPMKRIDAATARQIEAKIAEKVRNQSANPETEAALLRLINGLIGGTPNYHEMSTELAEVTRDQLDNLHAELAPLGSVQSIRFLGVGNQGADVYIAIHESGNARHWRIALDSKGMIVMALVTPGL